MLQGIGTVGGSAAVLVAALVGANTFGQWRKQQYASKRAEQAERILIASYNARRALASVRSPWMSGYELELAEERLKEDQHWEHEVENRKKRLKTAQAYYNRLERTKDQQQEIDSCLPMARALFGEALETALESLRHQFWIVRIDVESYIDDENGTDRDFTRKIRRGMYDVSTEGEPNEITEAVKAAIGIVETSCLPVLRLEQR